MPEPLPGDEHRRADVQLEVRKFERRRVTMAHEVADQPPIARDLPRALAIRDPGALDDGIVVPHVVDHADEAAVEHLQRAVYNFFQRGRRGARCHGAAPVRLFDLAELLFRQCCHGFTFRPKGADSGLLLGGESHGEPLAFRRAIGYIGWAVTTAMVINGSWNKRCGPGGSARRLHQFRPMASGDMGATQARHAW